MTNSRIFSDTTRKMKFSIVAVQEPSAISDLEAVIVAVQTVTDPPKKSRKLDT